MKTTGKVSFRRGVMAGFSAPYQTMYGGRFRVSPLRRDLVSLSWEKVGYAMKEAFDSESENIAKATEPFGRRQR